MNQKRPRIELPKLRKAARGADCRLQLAGICNRDPATTVLAHRDRLGLGIKQHDFMALNMCSDCHDVFDRRTPSEFGPVALLSMFDDAWPGQLEWWFREGHIR